MSVTYVLMDGKGVEPYRYVMTKEETDKELIWNIKEYIKLTNWKRRGNYVEGVDEVIQDHLDEISNLMNLE